MEILRKYGEATTILFPLIDAGAQDFENTPVTFEAGDAQISGDEGTFVNTTNTPAHRGNGIYSLALTATEMQAARIVITIIDQTSPKAWEDQAILIATYGNAAGQHAFDLDTATQDVNVASGGLTAASIATDAVAEIADGVWDEARSGHVGVGTFGEGVASVQGDVQGSVKKGEPMAYRGHIENGMVVLDEPVDVPEGTAVTVEPAPSYADDALALATKVYEGLSPNQIDEVECIALDRSHFFGGR